MADTKQSSKSLPYVERANATTTPAQLTARDSGHALRELLLQAHPSNTANIEIGDAVTPGCFVLEPGDIVAIPLENPGAVWYKSVSGSQTLNAIGRD